MSFVNRESPYQMLVFVGGQAGWSALSDFLAILSQGAGSLLLDYATGEKVYLMETY